MRIRTIKPDFWKSEDIATLSTEAKLLALGLLNYADDEGYFNANHSLIKAELFALSEIKNLEKLLNELVKIGYIEIKQHQNLKSYGKVIKFTTHQKVNRPYPSKIKELFEFSESSVNTHGTINERSLQERKGKEKEIEKEGEEETRKKYIDEYKNTLDKKVLSLSPNRIKCLNKFIAKHNLDDFKAVLNKIKASVFLSESSFCDIDWIIKEDNFIKIMEGKYDNKQTNQKVAHWN